MKVLNAKKCKIRQKINTKNCKKYAILKNIRMENM